MSIVLSLHRYDGFGFVFGEYIYAIEFAFVTIAITRPTIEVIIEMYRGDRL